MPPVTPRRTCSPEYGRRGCMTGCARLSASGWGGASTGGGIVAPPAEDRGTLLGASARNDVIDDVALGQLFKRPRGQLLLTRRRTVARKFVEDARVLRGDQHPEVLVRCM